MLDEGQGHSISYLRLESQRLHEDKHGKIHFLCVLELVRCASKLKFFVHFRLILLLFSLFGAFL